LVTLQTSALGFPTRRARECRAVFEFGSRSATSAPT